MRPLKILHIVNVRWYNAVAWYAVQTALAQKRQGHTVYIAGDPASPALDEAERLGIGPGLRLPFSAPNPAGQYGCARRLRRFIEENGIRVVNAHQGNGYFFIAYAARTAKNKPLLIRTRGDVRPAKGHLLNRWLYGAFSHGVIATSQCIHTGLRSSLGLSDAQCRLILPAVDTGFFRNHARTAGPVPTFGIVGRIDKKKGHLLALSAFRSLRERGRDFRVLIAGPESDLPYPTLRTYLNDSGLSDRVTLLGRVPDIREVMRQCDCGVIPSTESEAICRVALEFMAMGVPVIASRLNGIPDVVKEGQSGFLFETGDAASLAASLDRFLSGYSAQEMNPRRFVEQGHALERLADASVEYYRARMRDFAKDGAW
ncbi:MAG: glycosyltransferase family 4 protein [Fibrobacterota bacterium]